MDLVSIASNSFPKVDSKSSVAILSAIVAGLVPEPVDLAAFAVLSAALVLAVTGFAALIYGMTATETQGGTVAAVAYLTMAFSGGSFMPKWVLASGAL